MKVEPFYRRCRKSTEPRLSRSGMLWPTHHYRSVEDAAQNRRKSHAPDRVFIPFGGPPRAMRQLLDSRGSA